jgi:hypothetical protein
MRALLAASFSVLLAGCAGDELAADPAAEGTGQGLSTTAGAGDLRPAPVLWQEESVPLSFDGNTGSGVYACVFPAALCPAHEVVPGASGVIVERPGANFTGLDLEMTWTAQTPASATLDLGFMVMASCEGCNSTSWDVVSGTSPLRATLAGVDVPLTEDAVVHVYVYNPAGFVYDPAVPAYAFASVDQAFRIEGTVSLRVPQAAPGAASAGA